MMDFAMLSTILMGVDREVALRRLGKIIQEKSIRIAPPGQPFRLASGLESSYYINGKLTASDPEGAFCIARLVADEIIQTGAEAIGGPTLGTDFMVGAVSLFSYLVQRPIPNFIVRKEVKDHGTRELIEGQDIAGKKVIVLEDVITTGGSVLKAARAIQDKGCTIVKVICLVDREQGGREAFERENLPYLPLFRISELLPSEPLRQ